LNVDPYGSSEVFVAILQDSLVAARGILSEVSLRFPLYISAMISVVSDAVPRWVHGFYRYKEERVLELEIPRWLSSWLSLPADRED
jgi:hypothetical protein